MTKVEIIPQMPTLVILNISIVETVTKVTCAFVQVRHISIKLPYSSVSEWRV